MAHPLPYPYNRACPYPPLGATRLCKTDASNILKNVPENVIKLQILHDDTEEALCENRDSRRKELCETAVLVVRKGGKGKQVPKQVPKVQTR